MRTLFLPVGGRGKCNGVLSDLAVMTLDWIARDWGLILHSDTKLLTHCDIGG